MPDNWGKVVTGFEKEICFPATAVQRNVQVPLFLGLWFPSCLVLIITSLVVPEGPAGRCNVR